MSIRKNPNRDLTTGKIAEMCKVNVRTVQMWCRTGKLKHTFLPGGTDRRIKREDFIEFAKEYGWEYKWAIERVRWSIVTCGLSTKQEKAFSGILGVTALHASNLFHALAIACRVHSDFVVIDLACGVGLARQMIAELPLSEKTASKPTVFGIVDESHDPEARIAGFNALVYSGSESWIAQRIVGMISE